MNTCFKDIKEYLAYCNDVADKLDKLQYQANPKMGIACVRSIIHSLRKGMYDDASVTADNEFYPKLYQYKGSGLPEYINETFNLGK